MCRECNRYGSEWGIPRGRGVCNNSGGVLEYQGGGSCSDCRMGCASRVQQQIWKGAKHTKGEV